MNSTSIDRVSSFHKRVALLALLLAPTAHAVDGVVEINQACAENSGCTAGDTPGLPVKITEPGSYRLTGNLMLAGADDRGIEINAANVTIDLNGFSIIGPAECTGEPVTSCTNEGLGLGIFAPNNPLYHTISVLNGDIRGIGGDAIGMSGIASVRIEGVRAISNAGYGFRVGHRARLNDCVAESNLSPGMSASLRSRITNCTAMFNDGNGISASTASLIQNSTAITNDGTGISCAGNCIVDTVISSGNTSGPGVSASDNTVIQNSTVTSNAVGGISCGNGCLIRSNTSSGNTAAQVTLSGESGYVGNVLTGTGPVGGAGAVELGPNLCNGNPECP